MTCSPILPKTVAAEDRNCARRIASQPLPAHLVQSSRALALLQRVAGAVRKRPYPRALRRKRSLCREVTSDGGRRRAETAVFHRGIVCVFESAPGLESVNMSVRVGI